MAIKFFLILTCFSLACCLVWAAPAEIVVRAEEGRWITEVIGAAPDGWPEVISRQSYPTKAQAQTRKQILQSQPQLQIQTSLEFKPMTVKGSLWPTTQAWSNEWEQKYSQWIENEVDTEFFVRYKVATDCADVAYSLRWIFSRMHGLPAAASLGDGKVFLTNETVRASWASLSTSTNWYEDRRFLAALNYLLDLTYTHSLWTDSYPVALNKESLISGSYHLNLHDTSGHTQVIHWMDSASGVPFLTLNSTIPRKVRSLTDSMLGASVSVDKKSALLRFRWAVKSPSGVSLKRSSEMPGYSLEQFSFKPTGAYTIALFEKLGYTGGKEGIRNYLYKDILAQFKLRLDLVKEAIEKCQNGACRPGTPAWEEWSTPSRDSRIKGKIASLQAVKAEDGQEPPIVNETILNVEGTDWSYRMLLFNWKHDEYSSDPEEGEAERWGAGRESWVQRQLDFFKVKVRERQEQLRNGAKMCAGKDCRFGTELWKKTSSNAIDSAIRKKMNYLNDGVGIIPAQVAGPLRAHGQDSLAVIQGADVTLEHLLNRAAGMNSSALATVKDQWSLGNWSAFSVALMPPRVVDHRWLIDQQPKAAVVWDLENGKKLDLPFEIIGTFTETSVALIRSEGQLGIYDVVNGRQKTLPPELQDIRNFSLGKDKLFVAKEDRLEIWNFSNLDFELRFEKAVPGSKWVTMNAVQGLFISAEGLYDVSHDRLSAGSFTTDTLCLSSKYVVLAKGKDVALVSRENGRVTTLESFPRINSANCTRGEIMVIEEKKSALYGWDQSELQMKRQMSFDQICWMHMENRIACEKEIAYEFRQDRWEKVNALSAKYRVEGVMGGSYRAIETATGRVLMTGKSISLIGEKYIAVTLNEGDLAHVINLESPQIPVLTNLFDAGWVSMGFAFGPYMHLTGFGESGGGAVFWRPLN